MLKKGVVVQQEVMRGSTDGLVYHIAAPIKIGTREFAADVLIKSDANINRMYVHEVALKEKLQQSTFKTGAVADDSGKRASADAGAVLTLLQSIFSVNPDTVSKTIDLHMGSLWRFITCWSRVPVPADDTGKPCSFAAPADKSGQQGTVESNQSDT